MTTTELDRRRALSLDPDPLGVIGGGMLLGYARVSTREQNLHRQLDALTAAGCGRIWQEKLSGKNVDRPELQDCLAFARPNDVVVVTELWRLGRNFQDLIQIVSGLRQREIGFKSLHEALDTTTPGGRMIFHVFAALGEFIREMIVQGTREGLDAARARGTRLGRPPAMNEEQIQHAKDLLGDPDNTVSSIARLLGVSRATIYKYVPELRSPAVPAGSAPLELPASGAANAAGTADPHVAMPKPPRSAACPSCGYRPESKHELKVHREGLETVWLLPDPTQPAAAVVERWHCERCQPHQARIIMCDQCGAIVMLGNVLAAGEHVPEAAALWLAARGWARRAEHWICGEHE
ncbi:DNA invertase Pin-like site-specific DNA recombinase [Kribbella aluminosa]|uniref:DNA invertase Pin-like site-specific DNA recombinase n=1 Tax=Kribbella aluminosa TaxID=416017 RepID=A0ABS4UTJ0_9ACTN|nr:recombinase family protein [Kribbella aluminosa]MBP2354952.1 DNA invertase Pin-like site-specific DNA recombinase [Kribbella aluminosa]